MELILLQSLDSKISSILQVLIGLAIVLSLIDYFVSSIISSTSSIFLPYGLYYNYLLFSNNGFATFLNSSGLLVWGFFQFIIYGIIIISFLELWKSFRLDKNKFTKERKFLGVTSFFIGILAIIGALILSYAGNATTSGLYTMKIDFIRLCIGFFLLNVFFSIIIIYKSFFSK